MMRPCAITACLLLVCSITACGSQGNDTSARLTAADVRSAFSASGIPVRETGAVLDIDDYVDARFFRIYSSKEPWLEIEIFETTKSAVVAWTAGGNIADPGDGQIIKPLAIIRNVIVTLFASATSNERAKSVNAVRLLRNKR